MKLLATFMILFSCFNVAHSADTGEVREGLLNKLLAPGPLMDAHKDLEHTDCLKCHDTGQGVPNSKCLECHKEIKVVVAARRGYHGLMVDTCIHCHSDHKGRLFDSVTVDQKSFDHKKTGYSLEGKHAKIKCSECHLEKREKTVVRAGELRYFGKSSSCVSCHRKDDVHFYTGPLAKKDCGVCHGLQSWTSDVKFDHDVDTRYKLEGAHEDVNCTTCHKVNKKNRTAKYKWNDLDSKACLSCHEDVHKTNLSAKFRGGQCTKCHNQEAWKIEKFDHKVTGYPLYGKHSELKCTECHKQTAQVTKLGVKSFMWRGQSSKCATCHADYHRFGKLKSKALGELIACQKCHEERDWKETKFFNHNTQTHYPLDGKHLDATCNECHLNKRTQSKRESPVPFKFSQYVWPKLAQKTCENCHKSPHMDVFSKPLLAKKCTECHVTSGWFVDKNQKNFNHTQTRFQLTGKHVSVSCKDCHTVNNKQVYRFPSSAQSFCVDCHKNQHIKQFDPKFSGEACAECHTADKWTKQKQFNHDSTQYKLREAHAKLQCAECHVPSKDRFEGKDAGVKHKYLFPDLQKNACLACHNDFHRGQLGVNCTQCHSETTWKKTTFDHGKMSRYELKGKHMEVKCDKCHKPMRGESVTFAGVQSQVVRYKPLSDKCVDCHKDPHAGNLGAGCNACHNERGWKITTDFHRNFTLHGVHYTLSCAECHKEERRLAGLSDQCIICHQKDDIHSGTLPDCGACHRQQFWEQTTFKHSMSFFPLRGIHRTLDCAACHANGIYRGTPSDCIDCHRANAAAAVNPPHSMPNFSNCKSCHNQFTF